MDLLPQFSELRSAVRRFTEEELEPFAAVIDATERVPDELVERLREGGYLGARLPAEYGGSGLSLTEYCVIREEFSRSHRVIGNIVDGSNGLAPSALIKFGNAEQKEKYVTALGRGEIRSAFALTEPGAGSDAAAIRTRATKKDGGWVLDGQKHYISGGDVADIILVMAVTDPTLGARGISAFLVESGTPGFAVTRVETTIGSGAIKLAELTFDSCFVSEGSVIGELGQGFKVAMSSLDEGRLTVSSACLGVADRLIEMCMSQALVRSTFGKPLADRQAIQWMLVDSHVELSLCRALTYQVLQRFDAGEPLGSSASAAKLACSEMVGHVADRAVQVHGGWD